jgi:hypothetical protein
MLHASAMTHMPAVNGRGHCDRHVEQKMAMSFPKRHDCPRQFTSRTLRSPRILSQRWGESGLRQLQPKSAIEPPRNEISTLRRHFVHRARVFAGDSFCWRTRRLASPEPCNSAGAPRAGLRLPGQVRTRLGSRRQAPTSTASAQSGVLTSARAIGTAPKPAASPHYSAGSRAPALDRPSRRRWKYSMPA